MMAAIAAAESLSGVSLFEKNDKLGKKLQITGKGRCNLTNNAEVSDLLSQVNTNPRFMNSAFYNFDANALMGYFEELGVPLKTERGGRVFPVSEKSDDINKALAARLRELDVDVQLNTAVKKIEYENEQYIIHTTRRFTKPVQ
jgi:predicted Rossmann fold flavoprotein